MRDWKRLRKAALSQGWRIIQTNGGHFNWYSPDGKSIIVSGGTSSDHRAIKNQLAMMRRAGFNG